MEKNEIVAALSFRHACKEFDKNKKIDKDDMEVILESGRLSPSSLGIEPWAFIVIENQDIKDKLGQVSWGGKTQMPTCSHLVIALNRVNKDILHNSDYIDHILRDVKQFPEDLVKKFKDIMKTLEEARFKENEDLINAYCKEQVYIACANMMTIASLLKIDSCPIGGFDQEKLTSILKKVGVLDTNHFEVALTMAFGYRVKNGEKKTRQKREEVIFELK